MNKIIKNLDNGKYFTKRYQDGFWSRDVEDAHLFINEDSLQFNVQKHRESMDNPFEDVKMIIIETVFKLK